VKARSMLFTLYGDYIRHFGGTIWTGSLVTLMGELGFSSGAVRTALSRTCQQGWLKVVRDGKYSFHSLTKRGQERMEEAAGRIFQQRSESWDGQWTVITYSLPEMKARQRGSLRHELEWLGFGRLIPGVWVSPNPLARVALNHLHLQGMERSVEVFTARHIGNASSEELVRRCWELPAINTRYQQFISTWQARWKAAQAEVARGGSLPEGACFANKTWLVHEYRKFLFVDPGLPAELLPKGWAGFGAWRLFRDYYQLLADGAIRFFEAVYKAPSEVRWDPVEARLQALQNPFQAGRDRAEALLAR
jgi:phenylacetic acid degradation operon negative regulatory protein